MTDSTASIPMYLEGQGDSVATPSPKDQRPSAPSASEKKKKKRKKKAIQGNQVATPTSSRSPVDPPSSEERSDRSSSFFDVGVAASALPPSSANDANSLEPRPTAAEQEVHNQMYKALAAFQWQRKSNDNPQQMMSSSAEDLNWGAAAMAAPSVGDEQLVTIDLNDNDVESPPVPRSRSTSSRSFKKIQPSDIYPLLPAGESPTSSVASDPAYEHDIRYVTTKSVGSSSTSTRKRLLCLWSLIIAGAAVLAIVLVFLLSQSSSNNNKSSAEAAADESPAIPTVFPTASPSQEEYLPTSSPLVRTAPPTFRCMTSRNELLAAIDNFVEYGTAGLAARTYGGRMGIWCLDGITNFTEAFSAIRSPLVENFTADLANWDMSAAVSLQHMFYGAKMFNGKIGTWDTSNVTDMSGMFRGAHSFNQDISTWQTGKVTTTRRMFRDAKAFHNDLLLWDMAAVTDTRSMFWAAGSFQPDSLDNWRTSSMVTARAMFWSATAFNAPIGAWDVGNLQIAGDMFRGATSFNQPLTAWNVSRLIDFDNMFLGASDFGQDLCDWDISPNATAESMLAGTACDDDPDAASTCFLCKE